MDLFIIRHGQSANNALGNIKDRQVDPPLTDLGVQQAKELARFLMDGDIPELTDPSAANNKIKMRHGFGITSLYVSPMYRTLQTVQPVAESLGLDPMVWVDLHEEGGMYLNHGASTGLVGYPGLTRQEIAAEFRSYKLPENVTDEGWWNKPHEGMASFICRAERVSESLRSMALERDNVALITHGAFIDMLLKALLGQTSSRQLRFRHHNTGITRVHLRDDGALEFLSLNQVAHLDTELVSDLSSAASANI